MAHTLQQIGDQSRECLTVLIGRALLTSDALKNSFCEGVNSLSARDCLGSG